MLPASLLLLCLAVVRANAADTDYVTYTGSFTTLSGVPVSEFTGSQYTYYIETSQRTVSSTSASNETNATATTSNTPITGSSTSNSVIQLTGTAKSTRSNNTAASSSASRTSTAAIATNTVPCNNYPEFCNRKYSNITQVCAHNSAFSKKNNAASNQVYSITEQLDDGIRMLQGETHWVNETVYNCHTSCHLLNAGTWQSSLETLVSWLKNHPYDVVTWLIVNSDYVSVEKYTSAVIDSGLSEYVYTPQYVPQHRDQWPTLGEMILSNKRVVLFMDYNANQTAVPYILDEFSHIWETPFSPTNQSFPCTQQRPPGLPDKQANDTYMYLANHNLNTAVDLSALTGGSSSETILIPNYAELNTTNGEYDQFGMLGAMQANCTREWLCHRLGGDWLG